MKTNLMRSRLHSLVQQSPYADRGLWLIGIPLITLTIQHIGVDGQTLRAYIQDITYWQNLCFNGFMATLALLFQKLIIIELDQRLPYKDNFRKRMLWQLGLTLGIILGFILLANYLYVKVWANADYWETFYHTDLPAAAGFILILNLIYVGFYLRRTGQIARDAQTTEVVNHQTVVEVQLGSKRFFLDPAELALFYSQDKITRCVSFEGKTYVVNQSLKQLRENLPEAQFFQANRQLLLNRTSLLGYQRLESRKLRLNLVESISYEGSVFVSKEKSPHFLKWLSG